LSFSIFLGFPALQAVAMQEQPLIQPLPKKSCLKTYGRFFWFYGFWQNCAMKIETIQREFDRTNRIYKMEELHCARKPRSPFINSDEEKVWNPILFLLFLLSQLLLRLIRTLSDWVRHGRMSRICSGLAPGQSGLIRPNPAKMKFFIMNECRWLNAQASSPIPPGMGFGLALSAGMARMAAMPLTQSLLFPDPRPLVERLGREFFRRLPERPGVYLMRDARDAVLYVGKAKNLRQRLCSYRVANPDRMPRRHLRMLRAVERIELQECPDESSALARESELLRTLKPQFNRAGTWPSKARFLVWRCEGTRFELAVTETPAPNSRQLGPLGGGAVFLRVALVRLLWFAVHPNLGVAGMPSGWAHGRLDNPAVIHGATGDREVNVIVDILFAGRIEAFCEWIRVKMKDGLHPFEKNAVEADLEFISDFNFSALSAPLRETVRARVPQTGCESPSQPEAIEDDSRAEARRAQRKKQISESVF
jgi:predicted GIY-YIG superfamily endonuclease